MAFLKNYLNLIIATITAMITWYAVGNYYQNKIDKINQKAQSDKIAVLEERNKINQDYLDLQANVKKKEQEDYEKYSQIQADNDKLISDVASAKRRLRIKASSCGPTSTEATTSGVGNGEASRADIDSGDAQSIISITNKADKYKSQLEALQNYINTYNSSIDKSNERIK